MPGKPKDPNRGNGLLERLIPFHHIDQSSDKAYVMEQIRSRFLTAGRFAVKNTPEGPDQTIAIRKLHEASQAFISALACNPEDL